MANKSIEERAKDLLSFGPFEKDSEYAMGYSTGASFGYQACNEDVVKVVEYMRAKLAESHIPYDYSVKYDTLTDLLTELKTLK